MKNISDDSVVNLFPAEPKPLVSQYSFDDFDNGGNGGGNGFLRRFLFNRLDNAINDEPKTTPQGTMAPQSNISMTPQPRTGLLHNL